MNLFSFIKSQLSIVDVIQEYTTLKKAGVYWKSQCPFHAEKTASFTVSPHKEIFYCFGCHTGGDVITFMAKMENCSPLDAAFLLIDRYKINVPETVTKTSGIPHQEKNNYFDLCKFIAQWCAQALKNNLHVQHYLAKRAISQSSIDYFTLGYFPGGLPAIKAFLNFMQTHNYLPHDLLNTHFLAQGKTVLYSPFEERIIFPIKDHLGRFCGFGGRTFKEQDERAKYYNSRENEFFSKGSLLFGLDLAKKNIQKTETVILVEGYTDCIAMVQHGYTHCVATLGTACTLEHLTAIARYANRLIVVYDGDRAGQDAMLRLTQLCWQVNLELSVIELPAKEDPASFLNKGHDLDPLLEKKKDIFEYFIQSHGSAFAQKTLSEKLTIARTIIETIYKIEDALKRDILLTKAAQALEIPFTSLQDEYALVQKRLKSKKEPSEAKIAPEGGGDNTDPEGTNKLEKQIFFAIINNMHLLNRENEEYLLTYLPHPYNSILCQLNEAKKTNPTLDFIQFFDSLEEKDQNYVSKILLEFNEPADASNFDFLLTNLQKKNWKMIVHRIKLNLTQARAQGDHKKIETIVHDFLMLKKKMLGKDLI